MAKLRSLEGRIGASEDSGLISSAQARDWRERVALLKMKFGLDRKPDGSGLSPAELKRLAQMIRTMTMTKMTTSSK